MKLTPKILDNVDWSSSREYDLSFEGFIPALVDLELLEHENIS